MLATACTMIARQRFFFVGGIRIAWGKNEALYQSNFVIAHALARYSWICLVELRSNPDLHRITFLDCLLTHEVWRGNARQTIHIPCQLELERLTHDENIHEDVQILDEIDTVQRHASFPHNF